MYGCGDATYMDGIPDNSFRTVYCMQHNSVILTKNGFKYIQNLGLNDEVWTHKGRWKKFVGNQCFKPKDNFIKIITSSNPMGVITTKDHPILTNTCGPNKYGAFNKHIYAKASLKTEFVTADKLSKMYLSVCPIVNYCKKTTKIDLAYFLKENSQVTLYRNVM
jgi:hypothetical protein